LARALETLAHAAKLLAVVNRRPDFANVPLLPEIYPAMDFQAWIGIFARRGAAIDRDGHGSSDE